jgi:hypothetical protein
MGFSYSCKLYLLLSLEPMKLELMQMREVKINIAIYIRGFSSLHKFITHIL